MQQREIGVRVDRLTKRFGDFSAVDELSIDIGKGELFCLLGGSGSGKSTLLRMLAGFETPDTGTIEIDGVDMTHVPPADRPVNMMFQSYALFPHMSVARNVGYGLRQERLARAEIEDRVARSLDMVRLGEFAARKPHQLSGGQRQRVALARALIKRPKVLLLDEPLSALDKKLREETQFELMNIQEDLGTTFVVVTHDQEEAMVLAERIGVMDKGRLVQVDTPRRIYEMPRNRFIADFVGSVNILDGQVSSKVQDGRVRVDVPSLDLELDAVTDQTLTKGQKVWVAIRPEKIALDAPAGLVSATVKDYAYRGDLTQYLLDLPGGGTLRATRTNRDRGEGGAFTWDDTVGVTIAPGAAVVLVE